MECFGKNIKDLRKKRGITQHELAEMLSNKYMGGKKFMHSTISNYEQGVSKPEFDTLIHLSNLFEITLDELVFGTPKPQDSTPAKNKSSPSEIDSDLREEEIIELLRENRQLQKKVSKLQEEVIRLKEQKESSSHPKDTTTAFN